MRRAAATIAAVRTGRQAGRVPTQSVTEKAAGGKSSVRQKVSIPGYVFAELDMTELVRNVITDTFRVKGFVGGRSPLQVSPAQIDSIRRGLAGGAPTRRARVTRHAGDHVRVIAGPFANFSGRVDEVSTGKQKSRRPVSISLFGRLMPVELDVSALAKQG